MPVYSAGGVSTLTTATANAPLVGFRGSTTVRCAVREIGVFMLTGATTSGNLGLQRSTALGTGSLTSVTGQAHDPGDPATSGVLVTNWATLKPTTADVYFKRFALATSIGSGFIWRFDEGPGLVVPLGSAATGELVICNLTATAPGTFQVWITWEE